MGWKGFWDEIQLTRRDRIGLVVVLAMVMLNIFLPRLLQEVFPAKTEPVDTAWMALLDSLVTGEDPADGKPGGAYPYTAGRSPGHSSYPHRITLTPVPFDPNSQDPAVWQELGLPERNIRTILNYLSKGGRFRKKEDLKRIYGLDSLHWKQLEPYIRISDPVRTGSFGNAGTEKEIWETRSRPAPAVVDINRADSAEWEALPGIGEKLSSRIVQFREKLGGFYSLEQLREVYGLADSVFQKIRPRLVNASPALRKIRINTCTEDELKAHPYVRWKLAKLIIAYREQHGPYQSVEDLRSVMGLTAGDVERIGRYIEF